VRSFNRLVTQRVGALSDEYLARSHPLGSSRILWEIGPAGVDVRELRSRLDLDSGYVSRILRGLESEGLVRTRPATGDQRVRVADLTAAGRSEWQELDRRSDELAEALLAPLGPGQRNLLVEAMRTVERLLTAGLVELADEPLASADVQRCMKHYFDELQTRFEAGFDPQVGAAHDADNLVPPQGVVLVARLHGSPVGIGCLTFDDNNAAEVKRLWVDPSARGLGVARRILAALEARAIDHGARVAQLDTNSSLVEAIALYRAAGYVEVPPYNDNPYAQHWFEKLLGESAGSPTK
jgi:DNA-binding MarR family transcriptional regulator